MRNTFLRTVAGAFEGLPPILIPFFALFCGCCIRGFYLYDLSLLPVGDQIVGPDVGEYYSWACRILAGEILPESVPIHAPIYAYFLAVLSSFCSHQVLEMRFLQSALMMCLTVYPVYYSLRVIYFAPENQTLDRPWTMRFIPFVSCWILALYPPLAIYQCDFFAENLVCVFLAFAVYFMLLADKNKLPGRFGYFAAAGICCALAVLTHPSCILFVVFVFIYLLIRGILGRGLVSRNRKIFTAFAFIIPVLILTSAWSFHVSKLASRPVFVQGNGGFNFYLGNRKGASGACDVPPGKEWYKIHGEAAAEAEKKKISADRLLVEKTLQGFLLSPGETAMRICRKLLYVFSASELSTWSDITALKKSFFHKYLFHYFFLFLSLIAGMVFFTRIWKRRFLHDMRYFILLGASVVLVQLLTVSSGRYRLALVIPLGAIASLFFVAPGRTLKNYGKSIFIFVLLLGAGIGGYLLDEERRGGDLRDHAAILLAESHLKKGEHRQCMTVLDEMKRNAFSNKKFIAQEYDLLAKSYIMQKDHTSARRVLEEGLQKAPEDFALLLNYGILLMDTGKWKEAFQIFEKASLLPCSRSNLADLQYNYGLLYQKNGDLKQAERYYYSVLQFDPLHPKALNNLGVLLIQIGQSAQAEVFLRRACAMEPGKEEFFLNLAVAQKISGKLDEMEISCRKALQLNPGSKALILLEESRKK